jgi:uncharacterized protein (TIGR03000 family)
MSVRVLIPLALAALLPAAAAAQMLPRAPGPPGPPGPVLLPRGLGVGQPFDSPAGGFRLSTINRLGGPVFGITPSGIVFVSGYSPYYAYPYYGFPYAYDPELYDPTPSVRPGKTELPPLPSWPERVPEALRVPAGLARAPSKPNSATVTVRAPADAEVWIDGTKLDAATRNFESPDLPADGSKAVELKALFKRDGRDVEIKLPLTLKPGDRQEVTIVPPAEQGGASARGGR